MSVDLQGRALWDYYTRGRNALYMHTSYAPKHQMPLAAFFKDPESERLEKVALDNCQGSVLDVGAGAGRFSLALQNRNKQVTALEISPLSCQVMRERGITNVIQQSYWEHSGEYDTVLLMMNGIGIAQTLKNVPDFLHKAQSLLAPNGQIILDSSDLEYLYDDDNPKPVDKYYGEVEYCYEYKSTKGTPFTWLFCDVETLFAESKKAGLVADLLHGPQDHQFLIKMYKP